jgi:ATP-dependent DNA helicase RecQ
VLELAGHDGCQVARLGAHFGEPRREPCGHCSWCLAGRQPAVIPPRPPRPIGADVQQQARALRHERPDLFRDPRTLARLLCGLSSPRLSREKLGGHPLFGKLEAVPFAEVVAWAAADG